MSNKLATIEKIISIKEIPNKDRIVCAKVRGWDCIVKKDEFKKEDLCIFIEPDTIIFKRFVDDDCTTDEKIRLRTIKMGGQISQGLVLSLNDHPEYFSKCTDWDGYIYADTDEVYKWNKDTDDCLAVVEGDNITELLKVEKYEKPIPVQLRGTIKGKFPSFLRKTDEVNIQSEPELLEQLKGKPYYITQKVDGTSGTFYKWKGKFGVCSRNLEMKDPRENPQEKVKYLWDSIKRFLGLSKQRNKVNPRTFSLNVYWQAAEKYKIKERLPEDYAIQGEICGPRIQGNKMGLKEIEMFIFNVWDINKQKYLLPSLIPLDNTDVLRELKFVYLLDTGEKFNYSIEELLEKAKGDYSNGTPQEGIVVRSIDQIISFKVRNPEFMLKYGE